MTGVFNKLLREGDTRANLKERAYDFREGDSADGVLRHPHPGDGGTARADESDVLDPTFSCERALSHAENTQSPQIYDLLEMFRRKARAHGVRKPENSRTKTP